METFTIYPILGTKDDVPANHPSMFRMIADNIAEAHCAESLNVTYSDKNKSCSKAPGKAKYSNSATSTTLNCMGIYEIYDSAKNREQFVFMADGSANGRLFKYDSSRDPVRISDVVGHSGAVELASGTTEYYSITQYGDYMVFTDYGEHTPYCLDHDDTTFVKLISSGTEYKFRYIDHWQNYILGYYSDQTDGHLEIRWSNLKPSPGTDCTFASGDALYITTDSPIIGPKKMGLNLSFVYSENSISRLNYLGNYNIPFSPIVVIPNVGATSHNGIIDTGNTHFFYNHDYGFCVFDSNNFYPISGDIKSLTDSIAFESTMHISGAHIPVLNEVAWAVPLYGSGTNNNILFFNYKEKKWRHKPFSMRCMHTIFFYDQITWSDLAGLGYNNWEDLGNMRFYDFFSGAKTLSYANTDGHLYYDGTSGDDGSDLNAYRVEPILDFGRPKDKDTLLEIWFDLEQMGDFNLHCYHRVGNTAGECRGAIWTQLNDINCLNPADAVAYLAETGRYHQIKWGTDGAGEEFSVNAIQFKYVPQGRY